MFKLSQNSLRKVFYDFKNQRLKLVPSLALEPENLEE